MTTLQPRYSSEEHARRGMATYEQMRLQVEHGNRGRIVAIDVDTGIFEVADNTLTASQQLLARYPDAQIWCVRIGHPAVHRFGPRVGRHMMSGLVNAELEPLRELTQQARLVNNGQTPNH